MTRSTLWTIVAVLAVGAGSTMLHNAYQERARQAQAEARPSGGSCSLCAAHKADLELMRQEKARSSDREKKDDADEE